MSEGPDDPCVCGHERELHNHSVPDSHWCRDCNGGCAFFTLDPEMVKVRVCVAMMTNGYHVACADQGCDDDELVVDVSHLMGFGRCADQITFREFWIRKPVSP